jgi:hypothetical protein
LADIFVSSSMNDGHRGHVGQMLASADPSGLAELEQLTYRTELGVLRIRATEIVGNVDRFHAAAILTRILAEPALDSETGVAAGNLFMSLDPEGGVPLLRAYVESRRQTPQDSLPIMAIVVVHDQAWGVDQLGRLAEDQETDNASRSGAIQLLLDYDRRRAEAAIHVIVRNTSIDSDARLDASDLVRDVAARMALWLFLVEDRKAALATRISAAERAGKVNAERAAAGLATVAADPGVDDPQRVEAGQLAVMFDEPSGLDILADLAADLGDQCQRVVAARVVTQRRPARGLPLLLAVSQNRKLPVIVREEARRTIQEYDRSRGLTELTGLVHEDDLPASIRLSVVQRAPRLGGRQRAKLELDLAAGEGLSVDERIDLARKHTTWHSDTAGRILLAVAEGAHHNSTHRARAARVLADVDKRLAVRAFQTLLLDRAWRGNSLMELAADLAAIDRVAGAAAYRVLKNDPRLAWRLQTRAGEEAKRLAE